jgi:hypothetical protein
VPGKIIAFVYSDWYIVTPPETQTDENARSPDHPMIGSRGPSGDSYSGDGIYIV